MPEFSKRVLHIAGSVRYCRGWRCGLVVDTWLRDQKVPGSSLGYARPMLSPWERLFTCISSPHSCVKRVPDYRQYVGASFVMAAPL